MGNVYIEYEDIAHLRLKNTSGGALVLGDFTVLGGLACVADGSIASNAVGSFHVEAGIICQTTALQTAENTFATENQDVFWDPATGKFSDTETAGYYLVGQLQQDKDSNGMIKFIKYFNATLVVGT